MLLKTIILWLAIHLSNGSDCYNRLRQLGDLQGHLIQCITTNSVPVTMCINCADKYHPFLESYDGLVEKCRSEYFDNDRLNGVASTTSALTVLWSRAFCDDCSNNNNSIIFDQKSTKFNDCLKTHKIDPCEMCKIQYLDLNTFFTNLDQQNNGEVCYDLQDSMNRTRNKWSKELKCCRREPNMSLFAIALSIVLSMPLLFYGSTYFITKHQERNHGVLNNEDPLYNSELPTSSGRYNGIDINNSSQSQCADINNIVAAKSGTKPVHTKDPHIHEDLESSDDDTQMITESDLKKK